VAGLKVRQPINREATRYMPDLLGFALASLLIEITPGPNMTYLAILAAREGRRAGYVAVAGVALGLALLGAAAAFGLATLLAASPALYSILRWGGVLYLLFLAWDAWKSAGEPPEVAGQSRFFVQGLVTNLLNPKAALFYVAVMPNFLGSDDGLMSWGLLAGTYVAIATAIHLIIVTASGSLMPVLEKGGGRIVVARVLAVTLAGVALWLAWSTR
jgi:threonine/homoserine/homoserine lactone efflux protein